MMRFEYLGTTDERTTCECCGKSDLKKTVAIRDLDSGEDRFYGTSCAARALKVEVADVRKGTAAADKAARIAKQTAAREAANAAWLAARAAWQAELAARLRADRAAEVQNRWVIPEL